MLGLNAPRSGRRFATVNDAFQQDSAYWGERNDWYIVAAQNRDSDSIDRCNFQVLAEQLGESATIERANHWACGWVEYLLIDPSDRKAIRIAIGAHKAIENYPILDESRHSELEYNEFYEYAAGELRSYENWEYVLEEIIDNGNFYVGGGDETSEGKAIEETRKECERREEMYEAHARCLIDPHQFKLFDDVPHI